MSSSSPPIPFQTVEVPFAPALGVSLPDITIFDPHDCKTAFDYVSKEYFPMMLGPQLSPSPLFSPSTVQRTALANSDMATSMNSPMADGIGHHRRQTSVLADLGIGGNTLTSSTFAPPPTTAKASSIFKEGRRRRKDDNTGGNNNDTTDYNNNNQQLQRLAVPPQLETLHDVELLLPQSVRSQLPLCLAAMEAGADIKYEAAQGDSGGGASGDPFENRYDFGSGSPRPKQPTSTQRIPSHNQRLVRPLNPFTDEDAMRQLDVLRQCQLGMEPSDVLRTNITDLAKSHSLVTPRFSRCADAKTFLLDNERNYYLHVFLLSIKSYDKKRYAMDDALKWIKVIEDQQRERTSAGSSSSGVGMGLAGSPPTPTDGGANNNINTTTSNAGDHNTKRICNFLILLVHPLLMQHVGGVSGGVVDHQAVSPSFARSSSPPPPPKIPDTTSDKKSDKKERGFSLFGSKKSQQADTDNNNNHTSSTATSTQNHPNNTSPSLVGSSAVDGDGSNKPSVFSSAFNSIFSTKNPIAEAEERMKDFESFFNSQPAFTGKVFRFQLERSRGTMQTFMVNSFASWDAELKRKMRATLSIRNAPSWSVQDLWFVQREMVVNYLRFGLVEEAMSGLSSMYSSALIPSSSSCSNKNNGGSPLNDGKRQRVLPPRGRLSARSPLITPKTIVPSPAEIVNRNASRRPVVVGDSSTKLSEDTSASHFQRQDSSSSTGSGGGGGTGGIVTFTGVTSTVQRTPSGSTVSPHHSNTASRTASGTGLLSPPSVPVHPRIANNSAAGARPTAPRASSKNNAKQCDMLRSDFLQFGGGTGDAENDDDMHHYQPDNNFLGDSVAVAFFNRELQHLIRVVRVADKTTPHSETGDAVDAAFTQCCAALFSRPTPTTTPPIDRVLSAGLRDMGDILMATIVTTSTENTSSTTSATYNRNLFTMVNSPSVETVNTTTKYKTKAIPVTSNPSRLFVDPASTLKTILNITAAEMHLSLICGHQQAALQRLTTFVGCVEDTVLSTVLPPMAQFLEGQVELLRDAFANAGLPIPSKSTTSNNAQQAGNDNPLSALFAPLTMSFSESSPSTSALAELLDIHREAVTLLQTPNNKNQGHHHHDAEAEFIIDAAVSSTRIAVLMVRRMLVVVYQFLHRVTSDGLELCVGFTDVLKAEVELGNLSDQPIELTSAPNLDHTKSSFEKRKGTVVDCIGSLTTGTNGNDDASSQPAASPEHLVGVLSNPVIYNNATAASLCLKKAAPPITSPSSIPAALYDFSASSTMFGSVGSPFVRHQHTRTLSGGVGVFSPKLPSNNQQHARTTSMMSAMSFDRTASGMMLDAPVSNHQHARTASNNLHHHHQRVASNNGILSPTTNLMISRRLSDGGGLQRHNRQISTNSHNNNANAYMPATPLSVIHTPRSPGEYSMSASVAGANDDYDYYLGGGGGPGGGPGGDQYNTFAYNDPLVYTPVGVLSGFDMIDEQDMAQIDNVGDSETAYYYGTPDAVRRQPLTGGPNPANTNGLLIPLHPNNNSNGTTTSRPSISGNDVLQRMESADENPAPKKIMLSMALSTPHTDYTNRTNNNNNSMLKIFSVDGMNHQYSGGGGGGGGDGMCNLFTPHSWWQQQQFYTHQIQYSAFGGGVAGDRGSQYHRPPNDNDGQFPRPQFLDNYLKEERQRQSAEWSGRWMTELRSLERRRWEVLLAVGELSTKLKGFLELLAVVTLGASSIVSSSSTSPSGGDGFGQYMNLLPTMESEVFNGPSFPSCLSTMASLRRAMWQLTTLSAATLGNTSALCIWNTTTPSASSSLSQVWGNHGVTLDLWCPPSITNFIQRDLNQHNNGGEDEDIGMVAYPQVGTAKWLLDAVVESPSPLHTMMLLVRYGLHSSCASDLQRAAFGGHKRPRVALQLLTSGVNQLLREEVPAVATQLLLQVILPSFVQLQSGDDASNIDDGSVFDILEFWNSTLGGSRDNDSPFGGAAALPVAAECAPYMYTPLLQNTNNTTSSSSGAATLPLLSSNLLALLVDCLLRQLNNTTKSATNIYDDDTSKKLAFLVIHVLLFVARTAIIPCSKALPVVDTTTSTTTTKKSSTTTSTSAIKERIQQMYEQALQRHRDKEQAERLRDEAEIGGGPVSKSTPLSSTTDMASFTSKKVVEADATTTSYDGVSAVSCLGKAGEGAWPFLLHILKGASTPPTHPAASTTPITTPTVSSLLSYLPALPISALFKSLQFGLHVDVCNPAQPLSISASPPEVLLLSPLFSSKPTSTSPIQEGPNVSVVTTTVELQIDIVVFDGFDAAVIIQCEGASGISSTTTPKPNPSSKVVELQLEVVLEGNGLEGMDGPQQTQASMFNGRNTSGRPTAAATSTTIPAGVANRSGSVEMLGETFGSMQQVEEDGSESTTTSDVMELNRTQTAGPMSFNGAHIVINKVSRYEYIDRVGDGCRVLRIFMPITQATEMDTSRSGAGGGIGGLTIHDPSNAFSSNKSSVTNVLTPGSYGVRSLKAQLVSPTSPSNTTTTTNPPAPLISLEKVYECCLFTDEEIRQGLEEVTQNQQSQQEECDYECDPSSLDDFQLYCVEVSEDHSMFAQNALLADLSPSILVVPQPEVGADIRVTFPQDCHPATGTLTTTSSTTSTTTTQDPNTATNTSSSLFDGLPRAVLSLTFAQNPGALSNTIDAVLAGETRGDIALIHIGERVASVTAGGGGGGSPPPLVGLNDDHPYPDPSQNACNLFHLPCTTSGGGGGGTTSAVGATQKSLLMFESGLGDKTLVAPSKAISRSSTTTTDSTNTPPAAQLPTFHEVVNKLTETKSDVHHFPYAASSRLQRLEESVNPRVVAVCSFDPTSTTLPTATVSVTTPQTTTRGAFSSSCTFLDSSLAPNASTAAMMNTSTDTVGRGGGGDPEVLVHSIFKVRMIPLAPPHSRSHTTHANVALSNARSMIRSNSMARIPHAAGAGSSQSPGGTAFNVEAVLGGSIGRGRSLDASLVSGSGGGFSGGGGDNLSLASPFNNNTSSPLLKKPSVYGGGGGRRQSRVRLLDLGLTSPTFLGTEGGDYNAAQPEQPSMTSAITTTAAAATSSLSTVATSMLIVIYVDVDVLKRLSHRELNLLKLHLKSIDVEVPVLPEFISAGYEQSTAEWMAQRAETGGGGTGGGAMIASTNGSFALSPLLQDPPVNLMVPSSSSAASPRVVDNRSFARRIGSTLNGGDLYQSFAVLPSARNHNNSSTSALFRQGGGINNNNNQQQQQMLTSAAGSPRGGILLSVPSSRNFRGARSPMDSARFGESPANSAMFPSHASIPISGSTSSYPVFDSQQPPPSSSSINKPSSKYYLNNNNTSNTNIHGDIVADGTDWGNNKKFPATQPLGKIPLSFALLVNDKTSSSPTTPADATTATTSGMIKFCEPPTFKDASFPGLVAPYSRAIDTSVSYVVMPARSCNADDQQQPPISLSAALEGGGAGSTTASSSSRPTSTKHHTKNGQASTGAHKQTIVAKIVVSNVLSNTPILVSGIDLVVLPRGAVSSSTTGGANQNGNPRRRRNTKSGGSSPQDAGAKLRMPTLNMQGMGMMGSTGTVGKVNSYPRGGGGGRNGAYTPHDDSEFNGQRRKGAVSEVVDVNGVRHLDSVPTAVFTHFDNTTQSSDHVNDTTSSSSLPPPPLRVVRKVGALSTANPQSAKNNKKGAWSKAVPSSLGTFTRGSSLIPSSSTSTTTPTTTSHSSSPKQQLATPANSILLLPGCSTTALIELQVDPGFVPCHQRECHYARALVSYRLYDSTAADVSYNIIVDDSNNSTPQSNNNNMFLSPISQFRTSHLSVFSVLLRPLSEQETHQALLHNLGASSPLRASPECGMTPPPVTAVPASPLSANNLLTGSPLRDRYLATPPHCWGVAVGVPCHFDVQIRPDVNNQGLLQQELRKEAAKHHSKCALCKKHLLKATKWAISRSSVGGSTHGVGPTGRKSSVTMLDSTANHVDMNTASVNTAHSTTTTVTSTSVVDPVTLELLVPLHFQVVLRADPSQWVISGRTATSFTFPLRLLTPAYKRAKRDSKKKKNQLQISTSQFPPPPRLRFAALPVSAGVIDTPTASLRRVPVHEALHDLIAEYLTHVASLAAMAVPITTTHQQLSASSHRPTALSMSSTVDDSPQRPTSGTVIDHNNDRDDEDDDRSVIFDDKTTDLHTRSEAGSSDGTCFEHDESETEEDDDAENNDAVTREMFYSASSFDDSDDGENEDDDDGPLGSSNQRRKVVISRQTSTITETKPVAASVVCTREKFFGIDAGFTKPY